jgi:pyridoxal phosphate enzyme (YggS family)
VADVTRAFTGLDPKRIAANLDRARSAIADAGRDPAEVEILVAIKYVPVDELGALAEAGVTVVGENRAQDLIEKQDRWGDAFAAWDFIGALQSRKVKDVAPRVRLIHSLASESALRKLEANPAREVLIEVNVAGEESKSGIDPSELARYIEECPVPVGGLMCMPPFAEDPEASRPHFARLAELAAEHGLSKLSMGTTQDYAVAASEGATIVRLGSVLFT